MKYYILIIITIFITGCTFQANNAEGIILLKKTDDTLKLSILDSYYTINKYKVLERNDTLFIDVLSIHSPKENDKVSLILIPLKSNINYIRLQNDTTYAVKLIPYYNH